MTPPPHDLPALALQPTRRTGAAGRGTRPAMRQAATRAAQTQPGEAAPGGWSCWYTSSLALVSLAGLEDKPLGNQPRRHPCRVGVRACIEHLLESAPAAGLSLFSRLDGQGVGMRGLIFGPKPDITAVLQDRSSGRLFLPLAVQVWPQMDGGCELHLPDPGQWGEIPLPPELLTQAARLLRLVDRHLH